MTKEEKRAYHTEWQRKNKDKVKAYNVASRAKKKHPEKYGVWVSVEDRLPSQHGTYIVCCTDGYVSIASYYNAFPSTVTHWMFLPEPPSM